MEGSSLLSKNMKTLKVLLEKKQFKKIGKKSTWYKELGKELTNYFGTNCYWLPFRYEQWKIRQAFKTVQELGKKEFGYFIGILKKL